MSNNFNVALSSIFVKLLSIICFLLLIMAMLSAWNAPASNFEVSIYSSTPAIVWVAMIAGISSGVFILLLHVYNTKTNRPASNLWIAGASLLVLCFVFSLSLGIIRSYYLIGMDFDLGVHLGTINQIIADGFILPDNIYPIALIYAAELFYLSGTDLIFLHKFVPLVFGVLFAVFLFLLVKRLLPSQNLLILSFITICSMVAGWFINMTPNHLANLMFPMALFIIFNYFLTDRVAWGILSALMVVLYPVFHPLPSFILLLVVISLAASAVLYSLLVKKEKPLRHSILLPLLLLVWWFQWIQSHTAFASASKGMALAFLDMSSNELHKLSSNMDYAQSFGYNVYLDILKVEGNFMLLVIIALITIPLIWKFYPRQKLKLFPVYLSIGGVFALMAVLLVSKSLFGPTRLIFYVILLCMVVAGIFLETVIDRIARARHDVVKIASLLVITLLITLVYLNSLLILYPSPYTVSSGVSLQTTNMAMSSLDWLFQARGNQSSISSIYTPVYKYANYLLVTNEVQDMTIKRKYQPASQIIRYHFDYNDSTIQTLENDYLVITEKDQSYYSAIYPELSEDRFSEGDFAALGDNRYFQKVMSNGGSDIYYH